MKKNIAAALTIVGLTTIVVAQPGPGREGPQDGRMRHERTDVVEMLNLTPDQEGRFDMLRSEHQKSMVRNQADIRLAQIDLRALMQADNPDKKQIGAKMKEISDLQHQQKIAWLDHMFDIRAILTSEQIREWDEHNRRMGFGMDDEGSFPGVFGHRGSFRERRLCCSW